MTRLATITGKSGKPSIIVDTDMNIFIGNEVQDTLEISGTELFGFNTGNFDTKICDGDKRHAAGIAWRVNTDLDLVSDAKTLRPVCGLLHTFASTMGLADVSIPDHCIAPKLHPPVAGMQVGLI